MAKTGKFLHNSAHAVNLQATTAYDIARRHNLTGLGADPGQSPNKRYILRTLYIKLDTISAGPAPSTLTVRLTRDAGGNDIVVGDVTASISVGVTTATEGAVTIAIDFAYSHNDITNATENNLWCFWKTDAGTAQVRRIELVTEE